jgi:hypothetical protein
VVRSKVSASVCMDMHLQYGIVPGECVWMVEELDGVTGPIQCLVLHLRKSAVEGVDWTPGCEWWDRICCNDLPIDTLLCSVGSDVSQLPLEARQRALQEHNRFSGLSAKQREKELAILSRAKKEYGSMLTSQQTGGADTKQMSTSALRAAPDSISSITVLDAEDTVTENITGRSDIQQTLSSMGLFSTSAAEHTHSHDVLSSNLSEDLLRQHNAILDSEPVDAKLDEESLKWLRKQFPGTNFSIHS